MTLAGRCHCGNLVLEFETRLAPAELPLRACQCSFCRAHGVVSTADPAGALRVRASDAPVVSHYRFGLKITDFILCRHCGVYLLAIAEIGGRDYAVLNANVLDCRDTLRGMPQPMDYDAEDAAARRARRQARWTPVLQRRGV